MKLSRMMVIPGIMVLLILASPRAMQAAEAGRDATSSEALEKTQALLKNPALREQALKADPHARAADSQARALEGNGIPANAIYDLSSEIFEDLVKEANGDPLKMQEILQQAQKDPKGFAERMSEKNKRKLRDLSGKAIVAPGAPQ